MKEKSSHINIESWNKMYAEGRSLLIWPDEVVVTILNQCKHEVQDVLDVGCGAGRHAILMAQMGMDAYGIDSSEASIDFACKRAKQMELANARFDRKRVQDLTDEEEKYDLVCSWGVIHYLEPQDQEDVLAKIFSLIKPGGYLLCTLRSKKDSKCKEEFMVSDNRYMMEYFDEKTKNAKKTILSFWDDREITKMLHDYSEITIGHRIIEPIGRKGLKTAHWLVKARK